MVAELFDDGVLALLEDARTGLPEGQSARRQRAGHGDEGEGDDEPHAQPPEAGDTKAGDTKAGDTRARGPHSDRNR
ncbi:hypothetical protein GCM10009654_34380 [Streptomyces hebeiensis]|uniref:Uncharacterized protein n=1 Tax=Streptomyces hebeiensis TaxID=229486 RepID=A0ABN1UVY6_9ACTN